MPVCGEPARPGRVSVEPWHKQDLPEVRPEHPSVAGEMAAGYQQTQNTAIAQQDRGSSSLSSGISTLTVKNIISHQLPEQSEDFDEVVLTDLAADYAQQLNLQALTGFRCRGQPCGNLTAT